MEGYLEPTRHEAKAAHHLLSEIGSESPKRKRRKWIRWLLVCSLAACNSIQWVTLMQSDASSTSQRMRWDATYLTSLIKGVRQVAADRSQLIILLLCWSGWVSSVSYITRGDYETSILSNYDSLDASRFFCLCTWLMIGKLGCPGRRRTFPIFTPVRF